jgi:hypothetical protein
MSGFEVLMAVNVKMAVLWLVALQPRRQTFSNAHLLYMLPQSPDEYEIRPENNLRPPPFVS